MKKWGDARNFWVDNNKIYALLNPQDGKQRVLILDLNGKVIGVRDMAFIVNEEDDMLRKITGKIYCIDNDIFYFLLEEDTNGDGNYLELWGYKLN